MRILFIAPLPPPITGQTIASGALLAGLSHRHVVFAVDYSKRTLVQGFDSVRRIGEVAKVLWRVRRGKRGKDAVYFTITQSVAGNLKDLLIYAVSFDKLARAVIHLHGGGLKERIFDRSAVLAALNRFFLCRAGACVVLGDSLRAVFEGMVPADRIHVVPNFADEESFAPPDVIRKKFDTSGPLRVLFLSNLIHGKGHAELLEAWIEVERKSPGSVRLDFAGAFESVEEERRFLDNIPRQGSVKYHGLVRGDIKRDLLFDAHVLCLPTYYPYEGQPISILEGYAAGCVVIATRHAGIPDIFRPGENGFEVEKRSARSISAVLEEIIGSRHALHPMARHNADLARKRFRKEGFIDGITAILEGVAIPKEHDGS
jgi:glycosyltransferase involved in cell wall biosynthesis